MRLPVALLSLLSARIACAPFLRGTMHRTAVIPSDPTQDEGHGIAIDAAVPMLMRGRGAALPPPESVPPAGQPVRLSGDANGTEFMVDALLYDGTAPAAADAPATVRVLHVVVMIPGVDESWRAAAVASAAAALADVGTVSMHASDAAVQYYTHTTAASPTCDYTAVTAAAMAGAAQGGIASTSYSYVATTLPWDYGRGPSGSTDCTYNGWEWQGIAYLGGAYGWTRAASYHLPQRHRRVLFHELGHNLGLGHARADGREYGDDTCSMGNTAADAVGNTYNAQMLASLGWATPRDVAEGAHSLVALGTSNDALRLANGLVVSYRGHTGHDAYVPQPRRGQMYIHSRDGVDTVREHVGDTWRDYPSNIRVDVTARTDEGAIVTVAPAGEVPAAAAGASPAAMAAGFVILAALALALAGGRAVRAKKLRAAAAVATARAKKLRATASARASAKAVKLPPMATDMP